MSDDWKENPDVVKLALLDQTVKRLEKDMAEMTLTLKKLEAGQDSILAEIRTRKDAEDRDERRESSQRKWALLERYLPWAIVLLLGGGSALQSDLRLAPLGQ